jgi:LuxR family transcriptional regulator, maltose regulon positive regulatory protein
MAKQAPTRIYEPLPGVVLSRTVPPEVSPSTVPRPRLTEIFDRPAPHAIFIIAPSGYGKTTAAAEWASHRLDEVVWYSVAKSDTPADSILHIIEAFRRIYPNFAPWAEELRSGSFDQNQRVIDLANEIALVPGQVTLIVDNAHNFSPEHVEANQLFTNSTPLNMRTITIRNSAPPVSYARAAALDALTILTVDDLRLTQSEIVAITGFFKIDAEQPEVKRVLETAQGWPAGVKMLAKNFDRVKDFEAAGPSVLRNLDITYLTSTALAALPEQDFNLLRSMALFSEFNTEAVEAMIPEPLTQQMLRRMAIDGVFVSEVGKDSGWYEINPMIRQTLVAQLKEDAVTYMSVALKTANTLIEIDRPIDAVDLLSEIGAEKEASEIIYRFSRQMVYTGDAAVMRRWSKNIASALKMGEAGELFVMAYASMVSDPLPIFKIKWHELQLRLKDIPDSAALSGDLAVMQARIEFGYGNLSKVIELAFQVETLSYLPQEYMAPRALTGLRLGASAAFLLEDSESLQKICAIAERLPYINDGLPRLGLPAIQALTALALGHLKEARDLARFVIDESKKHKYAGIAAPYDAYYVLAEVNREYMENDQALAAATELLDTASASEMLPWFGALKSKAALIEACAGEMSASLKRLRECRADLASPELGSEVHRVVDENELFIRILLRDTERIEELLFRMPKTSTINAVLSGIAGMRNPSQVEAVVAGMARSSLREKLNTEIVAATLKLNRPNEAQAHIHEAIHLAMSQGHRFIFLTQMPEFQNLLLTFANSHPSVYVENLSVAIRENLKRTGANSAGLDQPLTKRELDILRRLSTGLPISQIASSLHISNNTIKTHLKNVYRKLGVDSRESAVAKGRDLLLI